MENKILHNDNFNMTLKINFNTIEPCVCKKIKYNSCKHRNRDFMISKYTKLVKIYLVSSISNKKAPNPTFWVHATQNIWHIVSIKNGCSHVCTGINRFININNLVTIFCLSNNIDYISFG